MVIFDLIVTQYNNIRKPNQITHQGKIKLIPQAGFHTTKILLNLTGCSGLKSLKMIIP